MRGIIVFALLAWTATSLTIPPGEVRHEASGLLMAHELHDIDLADWEDGANHTAALEKRTQVQVCSHNIYKPTPGYCLKIGAKFPSYMNILANNLKIDSNANDCSTHDFTSDVWKWTNHASNVKPENDDCTTTAQAATISGALQNYFKAYPNVCGVRCLRLRHGQSIRAPEPPGLS